MPAVKERPKPFVFPEYCKGCGRCISACPKHCISLGTEINPLTGQVPVLLDLEQCNGCGLCFTACPEPYGLQPQLDGYDYELQDPAVLFGERHTTAPEPHNHLFAGLATTAGTMNMNIVDQSGSVVDPADPPHNPGIGLLEGFHALHVTVSED